MAMDADVLKANMKADLILIFNACITGWGMSAADFADMIARAMASRFIEHIRDSAEVHTVVTGTAGPYSVEGTGTGTVS